MKKTIALILALVLMCSTLIMSASAAEMIYAEKCAKALNSLGLVKGTSATELKFELDREPTRAEALVMFIRILGEEDEALAFEGANPFTDVPEWADKYVGYAAEKGYTKGVTATTFNPNGIANCNMYLTFMLRAFGYSDTAGDFKWDRATEKAWSVGFYFPEGIDKDNFLRADVVSVSWLAMPCKLKGGEQTLSEKLIADGIFTEEAYATAGDIVSGKIK